MVSLSANGISRCWSLSQLLRGMCEYTADRSPIHHSSYIWWLFSWQMVLGSGPVHIIPASFSVTAGIDPPPMWHQQGINCVLYKMCVLKYSLIYFMVFTAQSWSSVHYQWYVPTPLVNFTLRVTFPSSTCFGTPWTCRLLVWLGCCVGEGEGAY